MFTKITVIILAIAIVVQSYCIRIMFDMITEIKEGYKLVDERLSEVNHISMVNLEGMKENNSEITKLNITVDEIIRRLGI